MKAVTLFFLALIGAALALVAVLRLLATDRPTRYELIPSDDRNETLVVLVHGLTGRGPFEGAIKLAGKALHGADRLVIDYNAGPLSNTDPYAIANAIELAIHHTVSAGNYREIVVLGHSAGAALVRKALMWGMGHEEDRERFGRKGKRPWVDRVVRFVSLAGINRGWSISPRPDNMTTGTYLQIWLGERLGRLSGSGKLSLGLRRGSPFIADTRVQWIRIARSDAVLEGRQPFPQVIQLIGDRDDVVSRADGQDLVAAKGTIFVTLPETGHAEIAAALEPEDNASAGQVEARRQAISLALQGRMDLLERDLIDLPEEDRSVQRMIYLMHGIRDFGEWTEE